MDAKAFNVADPAQLGELLTTIIEWLKTTNARIDQMQAASSVLAQCIAAMPNDTPVVKACLVERIQTAANAVPDNAMLQMLAEMASGAGASARPPQSRAASAPTLRLVVDKDTPAA